MLKLLWGNFGRMAVERIPRIKLDHYVYALFCQDQGGPGYVKIGITQNIFQRLNALRSACPVPVKYVATLPTPGPEHSRKVEKELLKRFTNKNVGGEWLSFDFTSKEDKEEFNTVCRAVITLVLGARGTWWQKISIDEIDRVNAIRKNAFKDQRLRKRILNRKKRQQDRSNAWKELGRYGSN